MLENFESNRLHHAAFAISHPALKMCMCVAKLQVFTASFKHMFYNLYLHIYNFHIIFFLHTYKSYLLDLHQDLEIIFGQHNSLFNILQHTTLQF